ncbi:unnamed protein product, partial [Meganyctiphanes norvegica]
MRRRNINEKAKSTYKTRLSPELQEHMAIIKNRYYSVPEFHEILKAIEYFEPWIWHELHTHYGRIISKETIDEIMADDKPPNNVTDKDSLGLILTLLTAEALKQDFDNVLIYVRFL